MIALLAPFGFVERRTFTDAAGALRALAVRSHVGSGNGRIAASTSAPLVPRQRVGRRAARRRRPAARRPTRRRPRPRASRDFDRAVARSAGPLPRHRQVAQRFVVERHQLALDACPRLAHDGEIAARRRRAPTVQRGRARRQRAAEQRALDTPHRATCRRRTAAHPAVRVRAMRSIQPQQAVRRQRQHDRRDAAGDDPLSGSSWMQSLEHQRPQAPGVDPGGQVASPISATVAMRTPPTIAGSASGISTCRSRGARCSPSPSAASSAAGDNAAQTRRDVAHENHLRVGDQRDDRGRRAEAEDRHQNRQQRQARNRVDHVQHGERDPARRAGGARPARRAETRSRARSPARRTSAPVLAQARRHDVRMGDDVAHGGSRSSSGRASAKRAALRVDADQRTHGRRRPAPSGCARGVSACAIAPAGDDHDAVGQRSASSTSCVTNTIVVPSSRWMRRISSCSEARTIASTAPNGSSINSSARLGGQRARHAGALLLAARKLARDSAVAIVAGRAARAPATRRRARAMRARSQPKQRRHDADVRADRQVRKQADGLGSRSRSRAAARPGRACARRRRR